MSILLLFPILLLKLKLIILLLLSLVLSLIFISFILPKNLFFPFMYNKFKKLSFILYNINCFPSIEILFTSFVLSIPFNIFPIPNLIKLSKNSCKLILSMLSKSTRYSLLKPSFLFIIKIIIFFPPKK